MEALQFAAKVVIHQSAPAARSGQSVIFIIVWLIVSLSLFNQMIVSAHTPARRLNAVSWIYFRHYEEKNAGAVSSKVWMP